MRRIDLIDFNSGLLQKLKQAGIRLDDYKYSGLYADYLELKQQGMPRKVIILTLAERYGLSDRHVYNVLKHLEAPV